MGYEIGRLSCVLLALPHLVNLPISAKYFLDVESALDF